MFLEITRLVENLLATCCLCVDANWRIVNNMAQKLDHCTQKRRFLLVGCSKAEVVIKQKEVPFLLLEELQRDL